MLFFVSMVKYGSRTIAFICIYTKFIRNTPFFMTVLKNKHSEKNTYKINIT